jgi:hypothetical protein
MSPKKRPIKIDPRAALKLIAREMRAPHKIRLKISLPLLSVPQGCFKLGGSLMLSRLMEVELTRYTIGPTTAPRLMNKTTASAVKASLFFFR